MTDRMMRSGDLDSRLAGSRTDSRYRRYLSKAIYLMIPAIIFANSCAARKKPLPEDPFSSAAYGMPIAQEARLHSPGTVQTEVLMEEAPADDIIETSGSFMGSLFMRRPDIEVLVKKYIKDIKNPFSGYYAAKREKELASFNRRTGQSNTAWKMSKDAREYIVRLDLPGSELRDIADTLSRATAFHDLIDKAASEYGIDLPVLRVLPGVESGVKIWAYSNKDAAGLWQFIAETAYDMGLQINDYVDERYHPEKATNAAVRFITQLYRRFNGSVTDILSAYLCGPGFIERNRTKGVHPLAKDYVVKNLAYLYILENQDEFGIRVTQQPYWSDRLKDAKVIRLKSDTHPAKLRKAYPGVDELNPHILHPQQGKNIPKGTRIYIAGDR
jgi:hypothetical protein